MLGCWRKGLQGEERETCGEKPMVDLKDGQTGVVFCRFCGQEEYADLAHLLLVDDGNPWCCDDCWDERLRG
jgi:hypothetical protein